MNKFISLISGCSQGNCRTFLVYACTFNTTHSRVIYSHHHLILNWGRNWYSKHIFIDCWSRNYFIGRMRHSIYHDTLTCSTRCFVSSNIQVISVVPRKIHQRMMSINLSINFLSIRPIRCSIVQYWIDSQRASSTTTNSSNSHLCKVIVEANCATAVVWLSWILLVRNRSITIKLHQCRRIRSLTVLAQPHFTILIILHLHTAIVDD